MKLYQKRIGFRYYDDRLVSITDPCYNDNVWCRINGIKIITGDYLCVAWRGRCYYTDENEKRRSYSKTFACGIYLNGVIPDRNEMEEIGDISVDAGIAGFFQDKPNFSDKEWGSFCYAIDAAGWNLVSKWGFCTESGYGDGCYPVYAHKNADGDIDALEIRF